MYYKSKNTTGALQWVVLLILGLTLGACNNGYNEDISSDRRQTNMIVRFILPESASAFDKSRAVDGYEDGSLIENYIDVQNSCKVLFFSNDNIFLGKLDKQVVAEIPNTNYCQYNLCGIPPLNLPADFKVMIAANWPDMSAIDNAIAGSTTIDDICNAQASVFDMPPGLMLDLEKRHLMPFFGIREYSGVSISPGTTELREPITLLRAMAKVEVIFDVDGGDSELPPTVTLCHYNVKGYCAPFGVYKHGDYVHNDWDSDYLHRLHLVTADNNNEPGASDRRAKLAMSADGAYRWTAYIPEYRNLNDADGTPAPDEAYIEIKLPTQAADEKPFKIYFSHYDSGDTSANTTRPRFNIERNNIYRFTVSLHNGKLSIITPPWNYRPQPEISA